MLFSNDSLQGWRKVANSGGALYCNPSVLGGGHVPSGLPSSATPVYYLLFSNNGRLAKIKGAPGDKF